MNVLTLLELGKRFTQTERAIAEYIIAHDEDVTTMTIGELAAVIHCSNSSIVRLCRKIGLAGYRDLRIEIARDLERRRAEMLEVDSDIPFAEGSSTADIANAIAVINEQANEATYACMSMADIRKASQLLISCRRMVYYAVGDSHASVEQFVSRLNGAGISCLDGVKRDDYGVIAQTINSHDVILVVSYSGKVLRRYGRVLETLRAKGCKFIVITSDRSVVPGLAGADCLIYLPEGEHRARRITTLYSQACIRYGFFGTMSPYRRTCRTKKRLCRLPAQTMPRHVSAYHVKTQVPGIFGGFSDAGDGGRHGER